LNGIIGLIETSIAFCPGDA